MDRVVHKATSFADAEAWDVRQQVSLTPEERQEIARELRRRVYGPDPPDVRDLRPDR